MDDNDVSASHYDLVVKGQCQNLYLKSALLLILQTHLKFLMECFHSCHNDCLWCIDNKEWFRMLIYMYLGVKGQGQYKLKIFLSLLTTHLTSFDDGCLYLAQWWLTTKVLECLYDLGIKSHGQLYLISFKDFLIACNMKSHHIQVLFWCSNFVWFDSLRPLNNLSVMRDGSSWVEPVLS